jgi:hypothetical protein
MTGSRAVRLSVLALATAAQVLGAPATASAMCAAPTYHGGMPLWIGECSEAVAGGASAAVWGAVVVAVGLWVARALVGSDSRSADLRLIDRVFDPETSDEAGDER